jgi:DNA-dependent RNA polymerase auxiliary subunit epsilon
MSNDGIVYLSGQNKAVRMIGDWVGISWRTHEITKTLTVNHETFTAKVTEIVDKKDANIEFINIRQDRDGEWYEDEDNYITDWLTVAHARKIVEELQAAIEYVEKVKAEGK